jgi:hypothetical protein
MVVERTEGRRQGKDKGLLRKHGAIERIEGHGGN